MKKEKLQLHLFWLGLPLIYSTNMHLVLTMCLELIQALAFTSESHKHYSLMRLTLLFISV